MIQAWGYGPWLRESSVFDSVLLRQWAAASCVTVCDERGGGVGEKEGLDVMGFFLTVGLPGCT